MEQPRRRRRRRWTVMGGAMCALALLGVGCATSQAPRLPDIPATNPYEILPGDQLEIIVWKEPQLSGPVQVRPDGKITLALLGDVKAAGLTPEQLSETLRQGLVKYIDSPNVVVRLNASSRRFFITGNVRAPGTYELRPNQTLVQAIAVAGGFGDFADRDDIRVIRSGVPAPLLINYDAIVSGREPDLRLQPDDTIVVP